MLSLTGASPILAATRLLIRSTADDVAPPPRFPVIVSLISKLIASPSANRKFTPRLVTDTAPTPLKSTTPGPAQPKPDVPTAHNAPADACCGTAQASAMARIPIENIRDCFKFGSSLDSDLPWGNL